MPFDFKAFDAKCTTMSVDDLHREWEHYTRLISGSATSTAVSGAAIPFTLGVSVIGVGFAAPAIHNARKKREIIEKHLNRHGTTHQTRKRDVFTPMAISGTVGLVTLGIGGAGASAITNAATEHGIATIAANEIAVKATTHLAVDGIAVLGEEHHMKQKKEQEAWKAYQAQQTVDGTVSVPVIATIPTTGTYIPHSYSQQSSLSAVFSQSPAPDNKLSHLKVAPSLTSISPATTPPTPAPPYSVIDSASIQPGNISKSDELSYFSIPPPPPVRSWDVSPKLQTENQALQHPYQSNELLANPYFPPPPGQVAKPVTSPALATPSSSWMGDLKRPLHDYTPIFPPSQAQDLNNAAQHPAQNFYGTTIQQTPQLMYPSYPGSTMTTVHTQTSDPLVSRMQNLHFDSAGSALTSDQQAYLAQSLHSPAAWHSSPVSIGSQLAGHRSLEIDYFSQRSDSTLSSSPCVPSPAVASAGALYDCTNRPIPQTMHGYPTPAQTPGCGIIQHQYSTLSPLSSPGPQQKFSFSRNTLPTPGLTPRSESMPYFPPPPNSA